jgi:hypothetical protein
MGVIRMNFLLQQRRTTESSEGPIGGGCSGINSELVRVTVAFVPTWNLVFIFIHGANTALHLIDDVDSLDCVLTIKQLEKDWLSQIGWSCVALFRTFTLNYTFFIALIRITED